MGVPADVLERLCIARRYPPKQWIVVNAGDLQALLSEFNRPTNKPDPICYCGISFPLDRLSEHMAVCNHRYSI